MPKQWWLIVLDVLVVALLAMVVWALTLIGCAVMPAACWISGR